MDPPQEGAALTTALHGGRGGAGQAPTALCGRWGGGSKKNSSPPTQKILPPPSLRVCTHHRRGVVGAGAGVFLGGREEKKRGAVRGGGQCGGVPPVSPLPQLTCPLLAPPQPLLDPLLEGGRLGLVREVQPRPALLGSQSALGTARGHAHHRRPRPPKRRPRPLSHRPPMHPKQPQGLSPSHRPHPNAFSHTHMPLAPPTGS